MMPRFIAMPQVATIPAQATSTSTSSMATSLAVYWSKNRTPRFGSVGRDLAEGICRPGWTVCQLDLTDGNRPSTSGQRALHGPRLAQDDEQVRARRSIGLDPALLPVLERTNIEAVSRRERGLREAALSADCSHFRWCEGHAFELARISPRCRRGVGIRSSRGDDL